MLDTILEFFGVVRRSRYIFAYETSLNLAREVDAANEQLNTALRRVADVTVERDLHKRESTVHAKTAERYYNMVKQAEGSLDVGAAAVGVLGPCGGKFSHYTLQIGIKHQGEYTSIPVRTLAANNKNKNELDAIAAQINLACNPNRPVAKATSLLREATAAPATDGKFPSGNFKPKGFA